MSRSSWIEGRLKLLEQCVCDVTHRCAGVKRTIDFNWSRGRVNSAGEKRRKGRQVGNYDCGEMVKLVGAIR